MNQKQLEKLNDELENKIQRAYVGMPSCIDFSFNRKQKEIAQYFANVMFKRTLRMFEYGNCPKTLSTRSMEKFMQSTGTVFIKYIKREHLVAPDRVINPDNFEEGLYALLSSNGGVLDENYLPTLAVVSNPYLGISGDFKIGEEGILIWNDSLLEGLGNMFSLYSSELTDNVITMHFQEIQERMQAILKANSDDQKSDGRNFLDDIENGKFGILMNSEFLDGLEQNRVEPFATNAQSHLKDTLEARQFLLAHWFIDLGLNDNYNMKRESLNDGEIEANADTLIPLIEDMLLCRREGLERLNKLYGTNITVDFSPMWKRIINRAKNQEKKDEAEVEATGVVRFHGTLVVSIVLVDKADFFDRITRTVKLLENIEKFLGDFDITDKLALLSRTVKSLVKKPEMPKLRAWNRTV